MATTRRQLPSKNRFDSDGLPITGSADTSVSSVATEPHEPSARRRVSPPSLNASTASVLPVAPAACGCRSPTDLGSPVRKNNPYQWNVLGEHASPSLAARTSPIPDPCYRCSGGSPTQDDRSTSPFDAPVPQHDSPVYPTGHMQHFDFPADEEVARAHMEGAAPGIGSYLGQCYSSAFPPRSFAAMSKADGDVAPVPPVPRSARDGHQTTAPAGSSTTKKERKPRRASPPQRASVHNTSASSVSTTGHNVSMERDSAASAVEAAGTKGSSAPAAARSSSAAPISPVTSPTSPMTRVYRNGRPVPVPAAARQ